MSEILTAPDENGDWLFCEDEQRWWRLTSAYHGLANGEWIVGPIPVSELSGQWRRPTDEERSRTFRDPMCRLLPVAARGDPLTVDIERCETCRFWLLMQDESATSGMRRCHRHSPMGKSWAEWPMTKPTDYCGDFERLEIQETTP